MRVLPRAGGSVMNHHSTNMLGVAFLLALALCGVYAVAALYAVGQL